MATLQTFAQNPKIVEKCKSVRLSRQEDLRGSHWSSESALRASSFPAKFTGDLRAVLRARRALSLSPVFKEARPKWYWTTGLSGSLVALSLRKPTARW